MYYTGARLLELFSATPDPEDITSMDKATLTRQVRELRDLWIDDDPDPELDEMTDAEIANAILAYAKEENT